MARRKSPFAERRGANWRARWPGPDGRLRSASHDADGHPFTERADAEQYGWDQMRAIKDGAWIDPRDGQVTLTDWINGVWWPAQDLSPKTLANYKWRIETLVLDTFGENTLAELEQQPRVVFDRWERGIVDDGYDKTTASDARGLLRTILADAVAADAIRTNPAVRPPASRGRRSGRRPPPRKAKVWSTPLDVLLIAERVAILSGHWADAVLVLTFGWTAMRWSEATGMQREFMRDGWYQLDWQLQELGGKFTRVHLKDDSYRTFASDEPSRVDLPPFLAGLLKGVGSGNDGWTFLGVKGGHIRESNWGRRFFRPACDGLYRDGRPVLVDATGWPGTPLQAWPKAQPGVPYEPPAVGQGKGRTRIPEDTPLASWLPIRPGLTPHGMRHGHATWMEEDRIAPILQSERLGHRVPGMRGVYTKVSDGMRSELVDALQKRWEHALRSRFELWPTSPVPALDALMAPLREQGSSERAPKSAPKRGHLRVVS